MSCPNNSSFITNLSDTLTANQSELQPTLTKELQQQATNIAFDSNVTGPVSNAFNRLYRDLSQSIVDVTGSNNIYMQAVDNVVNRVRSGDLTALEEQTLNNSIPTGSQNPSDTLSLVEPFKNIKEGFASFLRTDQNTSNLYNAFNQVYNTQNNETLANDCQNNIESIRESV